FDAQTGEEIYDEKLGGKNKSFTASPVAADDRIYAAGDDGTVYVIQAGKDFTLLSEHDLDDVCMVTPAITDQMIFFRTQSHLIAVGSD
ncbi:MAG: PQQ-binding-like beta-propeller repeat protein, partial [Cyclobacteriaceae bacterium]